MRKSLLWIILVVIFVTVVITGRWKNQETAELTSFETSCEDEITQEEYAQEEKTEEVASETTETNEKVEFTSAKQTDKDKTQTRCSAPQAAKNTAYPCQHNFVLDSEQPASCTANGTKVHKCTECGQINQEEEPAHGHNFVEIANSAPTCTNAGSHTMRCTHCGNEYSEQTAAPLGHTFSGWNISENHHSRSCSRCGHIEKSAHQLKDSVCQVCGVIDFR